MNTPSSQRGWSIGLPSFFRKGSLCKFEATIILMRFTSRIRDEHCSRMRKRLQARATSAVTHTYMRMLTAGNGLYNQFGVEYEAFYRALRNEVKFQSVICP